MVTHGTTYGYAKHKCRCDACREAHRLAAVKDRERNSDRINAYKRERYAGNPEPVLEQNRKWRAANPEQVKETDRQKYLRNRDRRLEQAKVNYQLNRDAYIARAKKWREDNRDRANELTRERRAADPEKAREQARKYAKAARALDPEKDREKCRAWAKTPAGRLYFRMAREIRRGVPYTDEALEWIASLSDPLCTYCGEPADSIDHIIAVSKGGTGERDNLTPTCRSCNSKKRNMSLAAFLKRKDR